MRLVELVQLVRMVLLAVLGHLAVLVSPCCMEQPAHRLPQLVRLQQPTAFISAIMMGKRICAKDHR